MLLDRRQERKKETERRLIKKTERKQPTYHKSKKNETFGLGLELMLFSWLITLHFQIKYDEHEKAILYFELESIDNIENKIDA